MLFNSAQFIFVFLPIVLSVFFLLGRLREPMLALMWLAAASLFFYGWDETVKNIPYDGRFTFVRVRYTPAP